MEMHICSKVKCQCGCEYCAMCYNGCPQCGKGKIEIITTSGTKITDEFLNNNK